MKSRIVQPAASFQPSETCTEHEECRAAQASNADLCRAAQAHYDKVSTAAHEWYSAIPKAIDAYYTDPERARLGRLVIEAAKRHRLAVREHMEYAKECIARDPAHDEEEDPKWDAQLGAQCVTEHALSIAVDALLDFETSQQQLDK